MNNPDLKVLLTAPGAVTKPQSIKGARNFGSEDAVCEAASAGILVAGPLSIS